MDGREVCKLLKSDITTRQIPIVILTGNSDEQTKRECYEAGADNFITKPFDILELSGLIDNILRSKSAQIEIERTAV